LAAKSKWSLYPTFPSSWLRCPQYQVTALDTVRQGLEDVFMQYFGKEGAV
jgi:hypothetical protein